MDIYEKVALTAIACLLFSGVCSVIFSEAKTPVILCWIFGCIYFVILAIKIWS